MEKNNSILSTKANTLMRLNKLLRKSKIEELFAFSIDEWETRKEEILNKISDNFGPEKIVVRSSATNEDVKDNSMAGYYESVLNVNSKNIEEISDAISKVISSYNKSGKIDGENQVLIQKQTTDIKISGVIFTRNLINGSPYYIINYDSKGSTNSVTGGIEGKTVKISRFADFKAIPPEFRKLIESVREIESLLSDEKLDIEFAINKKREVIIFQVRPITTNFKNNDREVKKKIDYLKKKLKELSSKEEYLINNRDRKIFADMPDWNPAEILGDNPGHLDYSLYDFLITKDAWHKARISQGYDAGPSSRLVYLFGNKPYVDVMNSFRSFLPPNLSSKTKEKLLNFYWDKLRKNPELQDKIEFEVVYTCYDFSFDEKSKELRDYGFSSYEIENIKTSLKNLTNNLIKGSGYSIARDLKSLEYMKKNREKILVESSNESIQDIQRKIKFLLEDCKDKGTVGFSRLARLAFIGKIILKSMISKNIIEKGFYDNFMGSIKTVATEFEEDFVKMAENTISKEEFIKKYYHLRPGTYDITSKRYDSNLELLNDMEIVRFKKPLLKKFNLEKEIKDKIDVILNEEKLKFSADELFIFIRESIESREFSKFEFTKNLSDVIELIANLGEKFGLSRKDISFLEIYDLFEIEGEAEETKIREKLQKQISLRKKEREINNQIELPPIIFSEKDFDIVKFYSPSPNYITRKKISSDISFIDQKNPELADISGKIVFLENGDPGYDWIFAKNPAGLITKYGGVASHMAIRCAEFGLPAAIGCGILFDKLKNHKKIILDCNFKKIIPVIAK